MARKRMALAISRWSAGAADAGADAFEADEVAASIDTLSCKRAAAVLLPRGRLSEEPLPTRPGGKMPPSTRPVNRHRCDLPGFRCGLSGPQYDEETAPPFGSEDHNFGGSVILAVHPGAGDG